MSLQVTPRTGVVGWLLARAFRPITLSPEAAARLDAAAKQGTLVYVARSQSLLAALLLDHLLAENGLPRLGYVAHVALILWQPLGFLWRLGQRVAALFTREDGALEQAWLLEAMRSGASSLLFLFKPRTATAGRLMIGEESLARLQQVAMRRPVFLVPLSFFYDHKPENSRRSFVDFVFGDREGPGRLRELELFVLHRHVTRVEVGELLPLSPQIAPQALRAQILDTLQQHSRVVRGPRLRSGHQVLRSVMRDPELQEALQAAAENKSPAVIQRRARRMLKEIAADYKETAVIAYGRILHYVFHKIYDGVVVDEAGFERVRAAAHRSTLVLTPCHKSHSDYLLLSYLFFNRALKVPHIAAGVNLSFWPLGPLFRAAGAFFMRRSFKNNPLYGAVFKAYVKRLLLDGFTVEFFPEGGRSRTGRLLPPKLGMFKYVVEGWRTPHSPDITIVPVAIDYEKIIEQASYQAELSGGKKANESISSLLKTRKILRSRYGRVYVRFGEPISLTEFAAKRLTLPLEGERCSDVEATTLARALSYQVMNEIGRVSTVTASALAASVLLHHGAGDRRQRGLRREVFYARARQLLTELRWLSAPISPSLQDSNEALDEALARFADERRITIDSAFKEGEVQIIHVPEGQRVALSYYQNTIAAHLVAHAIVATAMLGKRRRTLGELQQRAHDLSRLLKYEFSFRSDQPFSALFGSALTELVAQGILRNEGESSFTGDEPRLLDLYGYLEATIGTYVAALHTVEALRQFPLWERELVDRVLEQTRLFVLEGTLRTTESVQKPLATNAVSWLQDLGVIHASGGKSFGFTALYAERAPLDALRTYYSSFIDLRVLSPEPPVPRDGPGDVAAAQAKSLN